MIITCEINIVNILKLDKEYQNKLRVWRNQDFVRKKMFHQGIILEEEHKHFIDSLVKRKDKKIFISFKNDIPFGVLNYTFFEKDNSIEFGYYLINQNDINNGLGIILEYMLLEHAFNNLMAVKVFCRTLAFNNKVVNIHKKFGFNTDETFKENICLGKKSEHIYIQSIFKDDWNKKKEKIRPAIDFFCPIDEIKFMV